MNRRLFEAQPGQPTTEEGADIQRKLEAFIAHLLEEHEGVDLRDFQAVVSGCVITPVFRAVISERLS